VRQVGDDHSILNGPFVSLDEGEGSPLLDDHAITRHDSQHDPRDVASDAGRNCFSRIQPDHAGQVRVEIFNLPGVPGRRRLTHSSPSTA